MRTPSLVVAAWNPTASHVIRGTCYSQYGLGMGSWPQDPLDVSSTPPPRSCWTDRGLAWLWRYRRSTNSEALFCKDGVPSSRMHWKNFMWQCHQTGWIQKSSGRNRNGLVYLHSWWPTEGLGAFCNNNLCSEGLKVLLKGGALLPANTVRAPLNYKP